MEGEKIKRNGIKDPHLGSRLIVDCTTLPRRFIPRSLLRFHALREQINEILINNFGIFRSGGAEKDSGREKERERERERERVPTLVSR